MPNARRLSLPGCASEWLTLALDMPPAWARRSILTLLDQTHALVEIGQYSCFGCLDKLGHGIARRPEKETRTQGVEIGQEVVLVSGWRC